MIVSSENPTAINWEAEFATETVNFAQVLSGSFSHETV